MPPSEVTNLAESWAVCEATVKGKVNTEMELAKLKKYLTNLQTDVVDPNVAMQKHSTQLHDLAPLVRKSQGMTSIQ